MKENSVVESSNRDQNDLVEVLQTVKNFKGFIIAVAFAVMFIVALYDYFLPNIYQAETTIAIKSKHDSNVESDFMVKALDIGINNIDDEIGLIKSRWIVFKALENLNIQTRYFTTEFFKTVELYKNAPFVVTYEFTTSRIKGSFELIPLNDKEYRLTLEPSILNKLRVFVRSKVSSLSNEQLPLYYDKIHKYSEPVVTPWFSLNVQKTHQPMNKVYKFYKMSEEETYAFILKHLFINKWSEFSMIISLKFNDNIALRSKEILNALSNAYLQEDLNLKTMSADKTLNFLDIQLQAIDKTVQKSAKNLQKYKATNIIVDLKSKAVLTTNKISELEKERYTLNMQQNVLESLLNYIKSDNDLRNASFGFSINISEPINDLIVKIQEAVSSRNALLVDYTQLHPDVLKETEQIITLKKSLKDTIESSIASIKKRKGTLSWLINKHENALESLPGKERALAQLNRNFMVNEKIYSFLLQKRAETAIIQSSTVSETRIVDAAVLPQKAIAPKRLLSILFGFIFGLLLGVILALIRNYLDNTVKTPHDIEYHSAIPLYGAIPLLDTDNRQPFLESLRVVRTNLDFLKGNGKSKLVTVTSSVPSEGKTTVVCELGKVIAQGQRKVLLIDLDMRRSTVHEKFKLDNSKGMSTLLSEQNRLDEVIKKTEYANLDVITAGPVPPNPSELLMSKEFKFIIETLLSKYDYILLDTPPIEVVTDSVILIKLSDISLFVFRANYSKKDFIKNINDFVKKHELENSGIILNGVALEKKFAYGYKYGYYHAKR